MAGPAPAPLAIEDAPRDDGDEPADSGEASGLAAIEDGSSADGYEDLDGCFEDTQVDADDAEAELEGESEPPQIEPPAEPPVALEPPALAERPLHGFAEELVAGAEAENQVEPPTLEAKSQAEPPTSKANSQAEPPTSKANSQAELAAAAGVGTAAPAKLSRKKPQVFAGDQEDIDPKRQRIRYLVRMRMDLLRPM